MGIQQISVIGFRNLPEVLVKNAGSSDKATEDSIKLSKKIYLHRKMKIFYKNLSYKNALAHLLGRREDEN